MMSLNFLYAAHTYVDDWVWYDRKAHAVIGIEAVQEPDLADACDQLRSVAQGYSVMRNFKAEGSGVVRLGPVWAALKEVPRPVSDEDAKACVAQLVTTLERIYHRDLWSAASKFLWMRFREPIIIYDALAWNWMRAHHRCSAGGGYNGFYDGWRTSFEEHRGDVNVACEELLRAQVRRFLCPSDVTEVEFEAAVSSRWFAERVFDHAMVNAASDAQ
jgi:hypothetical protein